MKKGSQHSKLHFCMACPNLVRSKIRSAEGASAVVAAKFSKAANLGAAQALMSCKGREKIHRALCRTDFQLSRLNSLRVYSPRPCLPIRWKETSSWATKCANNAQPHSYAHLILFDNMLASMFNQKHPRRTVHPEEDHKSRRPGEAPTLAVQGNQGQASKKRGITSSWCVKTCSRFSDLGQAIKCLSGTTYIL